MQHDTNVTTIPTVTIKSSFPVITLDKSTVLRFKPCIVEEAQLDVVPGYNTLRVVIVAVIFLA